MYHVPGPLVFLGHLLANVVCIIVREHKFGAEDLAKTLVDGQFCGVSIDNGVRSSGWWLVPAVLRLPLVVVLGFLKAVQAVKVSLLVLVMRTPIEGLSIDLGSSTLFYSAPFLYTTGKGTIDTIGRGWGST